jgi:hypothetical protein
VSLVGIASKRGEKIMIIEWVGRRSRGTVGQALARSVVEVCTAELVAGI